MKALQARQRMLAWPNPVELVNNMYGCHPDMTDQRGQGYFKAVFGGLG